MINKIVKGISQALYREFGDDYEIYTENVEQGLKEPCFFIQCINPKITRFRGNRYYRENQFAIQYFPKSKDYRTECFDVIDRMYTALEFVEVDNELVLGKGVDTNIYDGVLTFTINYDMFVIVENDVEKMEILIQKGLMANGN
ncbi:MAG: hypothetical protein Q4D26_07690 [Clostridia bacterium]|nr:hypothetical protein [Clostridia bacterium]